MTKATDLVGGYTIIGGEKYGEPIPEDRIAGTTARFTEDAIVVTDKDKKDVYANTYTLDPAATPCRITMTSKLTPSGSNSEGEVVQGLIEKDGDTIRLIYALPGSPDPVDFRTREGQLLFVMKNLRK